MIDLVALIQRFQAGTKDEQQKQFIIKVVHLDCKTVKRTKVGVAAKPHPPTTCPVVIRVVYI